MQSLESDTHIFPGPDSPATATTTGVDRSPTTASLETLLDFRADSDESSLQLLAAAAVTALYEVAGCALDCAVSLTGRSQQPLLVPRPCYAGVLIKRRDPAKDAASFLGADRFFEPSGDPAVAASRWTSD